MRIIILTIAVCAVLVAAEPKYHTFESHYGQDIVAKEAVEVDEEEQYLIAQITPIKGKLIPTVNLHDFTTGYTAIKDEARETCYIMEVSHSLQKMMDSFQQSVERNGYFDVTKKFACTNKRFVPESEVDKFGERINKFCENHEMVYSEKHFIGTTRNKRSTQMMAGSALICGFCVGWCGSIFDQENWSARETL